ncbi:MAG: hypothetical protein KDD46_00920 [Bdellovibrionales bacterium]|nr:hypothetical protein [Bdellovibrionales bacterium]
MNQMLQTKLLLAMAFLMIGCGGSSKGTSGKEYELSGIHANVSLSQTGTMEAYEEVGQFTLTVSIEEPLAVDLPVDLTITDGTTQGDADFSVVSTVVIEAGQTTKDFDVVLVDDMLKEADEQFEIAIENNENVTSSDMLQISILPSDKLFIFGSYNSYNGNLGGRVGADTKCAQGMPLGSNYSYHAILSVSAADSVVNAPTNFGFAYDYPVQDVSGNVIWVNWAFLTGAAPLLDPTQVDTGVPLGYFWTGTEDMTYAASAATCASFTSTTAGGGSAGSIQSDRIHFWEVSGLCDAPKQLLCLGIQN